MNANDNIARDRHPAGWKITYLESPDVHDRFDLPEFYERGPVVSIQHAGRTVSVDRDGEATLLIGETVIRYPEEFRAAFPDGVLPEESDGVTWRLNAWFDLYDADTGKHLDAVSASLEGAVAEAYEILSQT